MTSERIVSTDADRRRMAFDAEHDVKPFRTIAKHIAIIHDISPMHPLVDDIAHAIEDAHELGQKRARALG